MERELMERTLLAVVLSVAFFLFYVIMTQLGRAAECVCRADPAWGLLAAF